MEQMKPTALELCKMLHADAEGPAKTQGTHAGNTNITTETRAQAMLFLVSPCPLLTLEALPFHLLSC